MWNFSTLFYFDIIENRMTQPLFIFVLSTKNNEIV